MCGIAGFAALRQGFGYLNAPEKHHTRLRAMSASLQKRGPDESGLYLTDWAGLSHARLSIIDLERGKQPMVRSSGGCEFAISYNGTAGTGSVNPAEASVLLHLVVLVPSHSTP